MVTVVGTTVCGSLVSVIGLTKHLPGKLLPSSGQATSAVRSSSKHDQKLLLSDSSPQANQKEREQFTFPREQHLWIGRSGPLILLTFIHVFT